MGLLLLMTGNSRAQDKGYVGFSLGLSIPMGDLASEEMTNDKAGLAREGLLLEAVGAFRIGTNVGAMIAFRSVANPVNAQLIANSFASMTGGSVRVEADPWVASSMLLGPYFTFPVSEKADLELKMLGGLGFASSPELRIEFGGSQVVQTSADGTAFTYVLGAGLRFALSPKLCLVSGLDYQAMDPKLSGAVASGGGSSLPMDVYTQPMSWLGFSLGLGLRL